MSYNIIEGHHITKKINNHMIIHNISFNIPKNSITLIEGHNGSGKSITLKIITGLINHYEGSLFISGSVSYAIDVFPGNLNLTIREYLRFLSKFNSYKQSRKQVHYFIEHLNLTPFLNRKLKDCSKGTKQKVNIIQCLTKSADIYILDEPFSGLDQETTDFLLKYLAELKLSATVIMTSHEFHHHNHIITHTLNIETGKFRNLKVENNLSNTAAKVIVINYDSNITKRLTNYKNITNIYTENNKVYIKTHQQHLNELLMQLITHQCEIIEIKDVIHF